MGDSVSERRKAAAERARKERELALKEKPAEKRKLTQRGYVNPAAKGGKLPVNPPGLHKTSNKNVTQPQVIQEEQPNPAYMPREKSFTEPRYLEVPRDIQSDEVLNRNGRAKMVAVKLPQAGSGKKENLGREKFSVEALDAAQKEREENERKEREAKKKAATDKRISLENEKRAKAAGKATKDQRGEGIKPVTPKIEPEEEQAETSTEILARGVKPEEEQAETSTEILARGVKPEEEQAEEMAAITPASNNVETEVKPTGGTAEASVEQKPAESAKTETVAANGGKAAEVKTPAASAASAPVETFAPAASGAASAAAAASEVKVEGTEQAKKSIAEIVEGQKEILPGGVNTGTVSAETGTSDQAQHTESAGTSSSVQSRVWNDEAYAKFKEIMPELAETLRGAKSIDDLLTPEQKAAMDPEAVARKKKGADFRRSMHELVELARIGSDIGASFAGGNAYKRKDPNYKQYEEEKAAVDKARNDALRSRLALAQEDRQRAKDLLSAFLPSFWNTKQEGQTSQTSDGTTHGETSRNGASLGHQPVASNKTIINNSDGARDGKPWTSVKVRDEKGNVIGSRRINFKSGADEKSYYASLNKLLVSERDVKKGSPMWQATTAIMKSNDSVRKLMLDNTISTQERYRKMRTLFNGGEVTYGSGYNAVKIKLTETEIRNAQSNVQLADQQFRDLLKDLGYNEDDVKYWDDQVAEGAAAKDQNAQPVLKDGVAPLD